MLNLSEELLMLRHAGQDILVVLLFFCEVYILVANVIF